MSREFEEFLHRAKKAMACDEFVTSGTFSPTKWWISSIFRGVVAQPDFLIFLKGGNFLATQTLTSP